MPVNHTRDSSMFNANIPCKDFPLPLRHSTEIAIFCPTFELAKTVCECFSLRGLKLDGQVAEVQVWVALSSAHLEDNRRQVDLYGRPCSPGRGLARSESNAKHRTIPSQ